VVQPDDLLDEAIRSFGRHLRAGNLSERTLETYAESLTLFARFLAQQDHPQDPTQIRTADVQGFITQLLRTKKPATASVRYRALQQFFKWLVEEGEIKENPMARMRPPRVPEQPPEVLREEELRRLLEVVDKGQTFEDRRDAALLRFLVDTGGRRGEVCGLRYVPNDPMQNDVDLEQGILRVVGKGGRERVLPIGRKTIKALDRYLRVRARHNQAHLPWLWISDNGRLGPNGILQLVRRRGLQAGIGKIYPHQLRHTFAHTWLANGGEETDLMRLTGWRSRSMLSRYGAQQLRNELSRPTAGSRPATGSDPKRYGLSVRLPYYGGSQAAWLEERMAKITKLSVGGQELQVVEQDFETVKEDWNEYRLLDGGRIRLKTTVQKVYRILDPAGKPAFTPDGEPNVVVRHVSQVVASD